MIAGDIVWVGTPDDVIERIEAVRDVCEGLTEISITVNPGGFDHWQAIKPGSFSPKRDAALQELVPGTAGGSARHWFGAPSCRCSPGRALRPPPG